MYSVNFFYVLAVFKASHFILYIVSVCYEDHLYFFFNLVTNVTILLNVNVLYLMLPFFLPIHQTEMLMLPIKFIQLR